MSIETKSLETYLPGMDGDYAVYAIVGSNGKVYVGETNRFQFRMQEHAVSILNEDNGSYKLKAHKAMFDDARNGVTFAVRILDSGGHLDDAGDRRKIEAKWIWRYKNRVAGVYNIGRIGGFLDD